jgi:peptide/nickel transport system ATP-binding protein
LAMPFDDMAKLRGNDLAMIFQDPMASLNPSVTIANQIAQVARWHEGVSRAVGRKRALEALQHVGISSKRADSFPHEFSGGMRQRAMIAMALVCRPKLLIADEPTTALDVTIQAQVLELLKDLRTELGMSMIFVTHDLGVVADVCDRVEVMYAGQIVESATVADFFRQPGHPYSEALLRSMPQRAERRSTLHTIPGQVPQFHEIGIGCRFAGRCSYATADCTAGPVLLRDTQSGGRSRCVREAELELVSA